MNASKENCRLAKEALTEIKRHFDSEECPDKEIKFLIDFLCAAEKKLPTEATFEKEKSRYKKNKELNSKGTEE